MTLRGDVSRLTVLVRESDQWHHHPIYAEVVHGAHRFGLPGASVLRGIEGFGKSNHVHTSRTLSLAEDLPASVVIVDTDERIGAFLPQLDELVTDGLVMLEAVEVVKYVGRHDDPGSPDGPVQWVEPGGGRR